MSKEGLGFKESRGVEGSPREVGEVEKQVPTALVQERTAPSL
jgi:hypothetical protein